MIEWKNETEYELEGLRELTNATMAAIEQVLNDAGRSSKPWPIAVVRFQPQDDPAIQTLAGYRPKVGSVYSIKGGKLRAARTLTVLLISPPLLFSTAIEKVIRLASDEAPESFTVEIIRSMVAAHPSFYGAFIRGLLFQSSMYEVKRLASKKSGKDVLPELWLDGSGLGEEVINNLLVAWCEKLPFAKTPVRFRWIGEVENE